MYFLTDPRLLQNYLLGLTYGNTQVFRLDNVENPFVKH